MDEAEDLRVDAVVEPTDDVHIILEPDGISWARWSGKVVGDGVLLKHHFKQSAPLGEVWWVEGENQGHMLVDENAGER